MKKLIQMDPDYKSFIRELKQKVVSARMRTMLAANAEQIKLYWEIGQEIINQQKESTWGAKLLEQVSQDLRAEFPEMKGFSRSNIHYMKQFAETYPQIIQQSVGQLPWGHIILLIQQVKNNDMQEWYARKTLEQGWARDALARNIKANLYARQGVNEHKLTNFAKRLPTPTSELAQEFIQDPIDFGFIPITRDAKEREVERELIQQLPELLLRFGKGFAFVGNQYHVEVGGDDFYIDVLLFNIKLNSYVVAEIKKGKLKPEHVGQLNFYLEVIDRQVKEKHHGPTVGLLLCESRNRVVAEYSLARSDSPVGIVQYQLAKQLPKALQEVLPSTELLEDQLTDKLNERHEQAMDKTLALEIEE